MTCERQSGTKAMYHRYRQNFIGLKFWYFRAFWVVATISTLLTAGLIFLTNQIYYRYDTGWHMSTYLPSLYIDSTLRQHPTAKTILFWNTFFGDPYFGFGHGQKPFVTAHCPETRCFTSNDRMLLPVESWDAIIFGFNSNDISRQDVPTQRSTHQRYIFFMLEAPIIPRVPLAPFRSFFNWTMTYRLDSDIPYPHSWVSSKPIKESVMTPVSKWRPPTPYKGPDIASRKSRMAAWFVSHCSTTSKREDLAKELSMYISVHSYGDCGNWSCSKGKFDQCMDLLDHKYKFYLAFENALCKDYVTEKFFNMLRINIVPVVFGSANYSEIAPPGSYIDAQAFPSVRALADHLILLDQNDTLYNQHFWWKEHYDVASASDQEHNRKEGFCRLCHMLHSDLPHRTYQDIHHWFVRISDCIGYV